MSKSTNISWHDSIITKTERQTKNKHKSAILWFTGLSGAGKSTITVELERKLYQLGIYTYRLDGDNIRHGLNKNLGFSPEDRTENIRRIGEVAKLFVDAGVLTLTAFISPYREDRNQVRALVAEREFIEVYVRCSLEACEHRDSKGLYQKARSGEITGFTGIDAPYEEPINPELTIDTEEQSLDEAVQQVINYLLENEYLN
ncbi:adenylyl-sulfate kinase [Virgibacillus salexigens]|uniref:Adenylyl-sulfate kinase n=1 Tax=Virgibacillus massiliensis TaxID=1462526 RepID=A0A024Q609_9BACI|nr:MULTISPECIES: adenylyl-sulfate kinase [Virgibacillus]MYL41300.1 adenylyl-sulfate kinase [Virgibacillus massiliensis]CDQ37904.1 putative adenylyl-sulfate kinase [Virgibacillus massiliensis]